MWTPDAGVAHPKLPVRLRRYVWTTILIECTFHPEAAVRRPRPSAGPGATRLRQGPRLQEIRRLRRQLGFDPKPAHPTEHGGIDENRSAAA